MCEIILSILIISNIATLYLYFTKSTKIDPKAMQLLKAIREFEGQGETILRIEKINTDDVFLRNPGR